jgi:PleD family two-component response regulator
MTPVLAVVDDLFFAAKIEAVAKAVGISMVQAADPEEFWLRAEDVRPELMILDLNARAVSTLEMLRSVKTDPRFARTCVIGYCSHVQREIMQAAAEAGCDFVLSRSEFTKQLPSILQMKYPPA